MPRLTRRARRGGAVALVGTLAFVGALAFVPPAGAGTPGLVYGGARTPTGGNVWARGNWQLPRRTAKPVNPCHSQIVDPATLFEWPYEPPFDGGIYFVRVCGGVRSGWRWVPSPSALASYANATTLELPRVRPATAPGVRDEHVVGVPVWLWIDGSEWSMQLREFTVDGVKISIAATPRHVEWDMGDGHTVVCDGPGVPFDRARSVSEQHTDCSYTYQRANLPGRADRRFHVVARVVWWVAWSASDGAFADLGDAVMEQPFTVRVVEGQALLTGDTTGGRF